MMNIHDFEHELEELEESTESAAEHAEKAEYRETALLDAIAQLEKDTEMAQLISQHRDQAGMESASAAQELYALRSRAEELQDALQDLHENNADNAGVLEELRALGEDITESLGLIEERQALIDRCAEELRQVLERLGLTAASLERMGQSGSGAGPGAGDARTQESQPEPATGQEAFLSGIKVEVEIRPVSDCCGVTVHGFVPEGCRKQAAERIRQGTPAASALFRHFTGKLVIRNSEYPADQIPYYSPYETEDGPSGVYYNARADLTNPRGACTTYFHELGHMIDHLASGGQGYLSNTAAFYDALEADAQRAINIVGKLDRDQRDVFFNRIRSDQAHSCSDLLDAATNGILCGRYAHDRDYWRIDGNLQAEAFAHFFEASMGGGTKLALLKQVFPSSYREFERMMNSALNVGEARERER